jgi:hypothetical protein
LVKDHLEQDNWIVRVLSDAVIKLVDVGTIELLDLPLDDPGVVVLWQFLINLFPAGILLGQRKRTKAYFLIAADRLHSCRPPCGSWN